MTRILLSTPLSHGPTPEFIHIRQDERQTFPAYIMVCGMRARRPRSQAILVSHQLATGYQLLTTSYRLLATSYRLLATSYRLLATGHRQATVHV